MSAENETIAKVMKSARDCASLNVRCGKCEEQTTVYIIPQGILDRIEAAYKRDIEKLNLVIQATVSRSDAEIDRLRREVAELRKQIGNEVKLPDGWKIYDKYQIRHTDGTPLKGKRYFVLRLDSDDPLEAARVAAAMSAYKGEAHSGNVAKLREALVNISRYAECAAMRQHDAQTQEYIDQIHKWANAALAAPARNCDVGTAEDKVERFGEYCISHKATLPLPDRCRRCRIRGEMHVHKCIFEWGQMPHNESEAGK